MKIYRSNRPFEHLGHEIFPDSRDEPERILLRGQNSGVLAILEFLELVLDHLFEVIWPHKVDNRQPDHILSLNDQERIVNDGVGGQEMNIFLKAAIEDMISLLFLYIRMIILINFLKV